MDSSNLPRYEGHLTQGCEGTWIDISTLAKSEWTCSVCRATVGDPEALSAIGGSVPPGNGIGEQRAPPFGLWPLLLGVLIGGLAVALILAASLYYQIR